MSPADRAADVLSEDVLPPEDVDEVFDADDYPFVPIPAQVRHRGAFLEMLISSIIGLTASLVLSIEAINVVAHPHISAPCDLTAKISCSIVAKSWQASLLGFPNAFLGLICEPVVITIAVAALAGVRFPRWFMNTAQAVYAIGLLFAYWLFYEAYFHIGALCPWCLTITVTTTLVFFSMTRINILQGNIRTPERVRFWVDAGVDQAIAIGLIVIVAAMVLTKYVF